MLPRAARRWIELLPSESSGGPLAKLVSYNILADGEGLALSAKHDYCPLQLRTWPQRALRLVAEMREYDADLLCLQECSAAAFQNDFVPALGEAPPNVLSPPAASAGLAGFHYSAFLPEADREQAISAATGLVSHLPHASPPRSHSIHMYCGG